MNLRLAGERLAATVGLGTVGAYVADQLAHSPMDRFAQSYRDKVHEPLQQGNDVFRAVYEELNAGQMTLGERQAMIQTLAGGADTLSNEHLDLLASSPRAQALVARAQEVRNANPAAAVALARITLQETDLVQREAQAGVSPHEVYAAFEGGAGTSPVPAALGGIAAGLGGAAAFTDGFRRNPDVFRVPRGRG